MKTAFQTVRMLLFIFTLLYGAMGVFTVSFVYDFIL